ncbi:MAG: insulinase family protein [Pirellulales bacterium]|nr:insulinase family protein [Pirellulales bacterium]
MKIIVIPMPGSGLVSYYSIVRTGSRDEVEPGKSGFAHFFEHMMFRGTKNLPGPEYDRLVCSLGAKYNASTTDDFTQYFLTFPKEDLEKIVEVESDRFQNLSYGRLAFQTEAGAVYGEYRKGITQPFALLEEKLLDRAFDKHTYKHTTIGFEADIKAMPQGYDYSRSFFERFYRPENVVILIVGDVKPAEAFALVKKYYGHWKRGYEPPKITPEPPQTAERSVEIKYPGRTLPILCLAYKGAAYDPENRNYVAARLMVELAFGQTSPLYQDLVLRRQLVQFLVAEAPMNRDQPLFAIYTMVKKPSDVPVVKEAIERTIKEYQTQLVDPQRLADVKRRLRYAFLMSLDSPGATAAKLARFIALTGGIETVNRLYAAYRCVTPQDVRRAARLYFQPQRRTVAVLKGE